MIGTVKFFNEAKGYGFITPDDGSKEIFVHINNCDDGIEELREGQRVRYQERTSERSGKAEAFALSIIES